jgi:hypothetical protein
MNETALMITIVCGAIVALGGYFQFKVWQADKAKRELERKEIEEKARQIRESLVQLKESNIKKKDNYEAAKKDFYDHAGIDPSKPRSKG